MTQVSSEISSEALQRVLEQHLRQPVASLRRRPWEYATSNRMEALEVDLAGGRTLSLLLKDLSPHAQLQEAQRTRPVDHYDRRREIDVYREVLSTLDVDAPEFYGSFGERLIIENVPGVPLWQCDYDIWPAAARWLARFHEMRLPPLPRSLLQYSVEFFRSWGKRASEKHPQLQTIDLDRACDRLASMPKRLIHGEFYPSNVLVQGERIRPIDWETAALAPGLIDLAALTSGKMPPAQRETIVQAYRDLVPASEHFERELAFCRLHLEIRWLGWSDDWVPPREHAQDWLGEALRLADELELKR